jgi:hypothetical protein
MKVLVECKVIEARQYLAVEYRYATLRVELISTAKDFVTLGSDINAFRRC